MAAAVMELLLLTTVLTTTLFSTAFASSPAPPQPCPATATELCDFYFETYGDRIPTFQDIRVKPDSRVPDHAMAVKLIGKKDFTLTLNTGEGQFLQCGADDLTGDSPDNQFYLENSNVNTDSGPQLYARTYNHPKLAPYFENRCILLPITSVAIAKYGTQTVNLNKGDKDDLVPEYRRCIVFRTGPENPCPSKIYPDPPTEVDNESYPEHDEHDEQDEPAEEPREVYTQPDPRPTYADPKKPAYEDPRPTYGAKKPTHRKPKPSYVPHDQRYAPKPAPYKQTEEAEYDHQDDMDYPDHEAAPDDYEYSYSPPPPYGEYDHQDDSDDHHDDWDHHDDGSYQQSYSPPPCRVKSSPPPCRSPPPPRSPPPCRSPPPPCRSPPPRSPPPCTPPPRKAPPTCKSDCPKNPLALCDFYFDGFKTVVPTFKLSAPGVVSAKSLLHKDFDGYARRPATIQVETCHPGSFLGCIPKTNKPLKDSISGQFYFNRDKLSLNPFRNCAKAYFANRCVLLPLAKLQFPTQTGTYTTINAGAASPYSPPARRCVVFKTKLS